MTHDELDLMQLASSGELLATVDGADYHHIAVVLAWPSGGVPRMYCAAADWPTMPAAKMAELLRVNERLSARVAELELRLAEPPAPPRETPVQNQEKMLRRQATALSGETDPPPDPLVCPDCGKGGWKNTHALDVHRGRAHAPQQFIEELGWRCTAKGCTGAHARSLLEPDFCTYHAKPHTNGHLVAAESEHPHDD